jgi:glycosyltransferase involved in cell wall biosynthesis
MSTVGATVFVVICALTTKRWETLRAAVDSVLELDTPPDQLVVVDHCPPSEAMARECLSARSVEVVTNNLAPGLAGARKTGTAQATGDVIVFLDDDAVAQPGWLDAHLAHHADPRVGCAGLAITSAGFKMSAPSLDEQAARGE